MPATDATITAHCQSRWCHERHIVADSFERRHEHSTPARPFTVQFIGDGSFAPGQFRRSANDHSDFCQAMIANVALNGTIHRELGDPLRVSWTNATHVVTGRLFLIDNVNIDHDRHDHCSGTPGNNYETTYTENGAGRRNRRRHCDHR